MITLDQYWLGRDQQYNVDWTIEIRNNAKTLLVHVNKLIEYLPFPVEINPNTRSPVSSGWRPPQVNKHIANAAPRSNHMKALAVDLYDPEGEIDDWCMDNLSKLEECGIWLEHPSATKGWSHWQCVPPRSGKRVFYP